MGQVKDMAVEAPSAARTVRWGIMGTGSAAHHFAYGLRFVPGAQLTAVGSRTRQQAALFGKHTGALRAWGSYEDLVADEVDVVYVATPHALHSAHCRLALQAGKPVLCEKPFSINASEAQEVIALARQKKLFCMEAMWMHFLPGMQKALELVRAGAIGVPRMLTADFGVPTAFDSETRVFNAALGGGALLDRGVYPLALAWRLFGPPTDVRAMSTFAAPDVDEHCTVLQKYRSGQLATLAATLSGYAANEAVIIGTEGRMTIREPFCRPDSLTVVRAPYSGRNDEHGTASDLKERLRSNRLVRGVRRWVPNRRSKSMYVPYVGNGYNYEALEVMDCLGRGATESATWSLDDTLGVMHSIDAVRKYVSQ